MKAKVFILALMSIIVCDNVLAYNFVVNGIYYNILSDGTTVAVTYRDYNFNSYSGSVTILSTVSYSGKTYNVTSIGDRAFYNCSAMTSVTIPNSVTSIGDFAFFDCSKLTNVTIPNSVTSIGENVFRLSGVTQPLYNNTIFAYLPSSYRGSYNIPSGITTIAGGAFGNCYNLNSVNIPNSVTLIGDEAFQDCSNLTNVTIPNSVTSIGTQAFHSSGITQPLYNNTIFAYLPASYSGSYSIPSGIATIAGGAFYHCSNLTSITIPNSVTSIGDEAFCFCSNLTSVTIPNSVTSIGDWAFRYCSNLTSVTISNSVTLIDLGAFYSCTSLTSVTIPNSVTSIGNDAFSDCSNLTSVTIPNSVTSIGSWAFLRCTSLTSVTIPNSVTSIGESAFHDCTSLTAIYFRCSTPPVFYYHNRLSNCFPSNVTTCYVPCGKTRVYQSKIDTSSIQIYEHYTNLSVSSSDDSLGTVTIAQSPSCEQLDLPAIIQASCASHSHFVSWSDGNTDNPRTLTVTSDTSLVAIFEIDKHTITAYGTNGSISGGGIYDYGSSITLNATANDHYHFANWSDGNTDNPRNVIVTSDTSFIALFEIDKHIVSSNSEMVEGTGEYDYGSTVTLTAHSDEHRRFVEWEDGVTDSTRSFVLQADITMNAVYDIDSFRISGSCQHGVVTGNGTYLYKDIVTLAANIDEGYRFVKWSDDNEYNPRVFVVTQDLTVEAICEEAPIIDDIENVEADTPAFYIVGNIIYNPDNELMRVYSTEGKLIKTSDSDVNMECYPKGIYMVVDTRGNAIKVPVQ